jgi:tripartite-type tricarboxylate transporter receptor subunit TctC
MNMRITLLLTILCWSAQSWSQNYPSKPVKIVVAFAPGAATDILAREVAYRLTNSQGKSFLVENRAAGAGGTVGTTYVAKSPPDGYTLLMANNSTHTIAPHLYKNIEYDPVRDFSPISLVAWIPLFLAVHSALPATDVRSFIELARSKPGDLHFSSSGSGTSPHLAGELFKSMAKVSIVHVPYKGAGAAISDLLSGEVQFGFLSGPTAGPFISKQQLRILGVTTLKRSLLFADVPTISEAGLPGYEMPNWVGLMAPARTPVSIINRLNGDVTNWIGEPETKKRFIALGVDAGGGPPSFFTDAIVRGYAQAGKLIETSGIKIE